MEHLLLSVFNFLLNGGLFGESWLLTLLFSILQTFTHPFSLHPPPPFLSISTKPPPSFSLTRRTVQCLLDHYHFSHSCILSPPLPLFNHHNEDPRCHSSSVFILIFQPLFIEIYSPNWGVIFEICGTYLID